MLRERDELDAARQHLQASSELGEHVGLPQNRYRWRVAMARIREADGDLERRPRPARRGRAPLRRRLLTGRPAGPRAAGAGARRAGQVGGRPRLGAGAGPVRGRRPRAICASSSTSPSPGRSSPGTRPSGTSARSARPPASWSACGQPPRTAGGRAACSTSWWCRRSPRRRAATCPPRSPSLRRALTLAEPEGYVRIFVDEGPPMAALLRAAGEGRRRRQLRPPAAGRVRRDRGAGPSRRRLVDPLSARELDVLRLLGTDLDGPDIARAALRVR